MLSAALRQRSSLMTYAEKNNLDAVRPKPDADQRSANILHRVVKALAGSGKSESRNWEDRRFKIDMDLKGVWLRALISMHGTWSTRGNAILYSNERAIGISEARRSGSLQAEAKNGPPVGHKKSQAV